MKILACRLAFLSLICSFPLISVSYAEDSMDTHNSWDGGGDEEIITVEKARELIRALPTAGDAIKGEVKQNADTEYYDIHGRQLAYRENAREMRASLDSRREVFETPRQNVIDGHRGLVKKVHDAEMKAYKETDSDDDIVIAISLADEVEFEEEPAMDSSDPDVGIKEHIIPPSDVDARRRKLITSDDAPYFDLENL